MFDSHNLLVGAVFVLAGFVKGVIGLGLPTVAMGLLAIVMPPAEAAAILIVPSLLTNAWQMIAGPSLGSLLRRLWPMMAAVCVGTWAGAGLMTGAAGGLATALLGCALIAYALTGIASVRLSIAGNREAGLGSAAGVVTGVITAATGVFVIPAVPYLQAIGLEKDELVQALGLSFTISTLALAVNVAAIGGLHASMAWTAVAACVFACAGMWLGQCARQGVPPPKFRRWFFVGLLLLGLYLAMRPVM